MPTFPVDMMPDFSVDAPACPIDTTLCRQPVPKPAVAGEVAFSQTGEAGRTLDLPQGRREIRAAQRLDLERAAPHPQGAKVAEILDDLRPDGHGQPVLGGRRGAGAAGRNHDRAAGREREGGRHCEREPVCPIP